MKQFVLKEKIQEEIAGCTVQAVLLYSFDFDTRFFENYVMPLFVPGKDFRDEVIYNRILWRTCQKEGIIPPVTVYCDYFAKDNSEAPSLGYDIHCIRMPAAQGAICNFHYKHILILISDSRGAESLVVVTGSGNLTSNGWCDNFECFSLQRINKNLTSPNRTTTNALQDFLVAGAGLARQPFTNAETLIYEYLRYVDRTEGFFNSLDQSLKEFLHEEVFSRDQIEEVEIIAPYFSSDNSLVQYLKNEVGIKEIKCLIPTLKSNEIQLPKEVFELLSAEDVKWCRWEKYEQAGKSFDRNAEVRKLHAKTYRFYGTKKTYTLIGSPNFTLQAWAKFTKKHNKANAESAWLYREQPNASRLLKVVGRIDPNLYYFVDKPDLENCANEEFVNRAVPQIEFAIDWRAKTLCIKAVDIESECVLLELDYKEPITNGKIDIELTAADLRHLTKNPLIKVIEQAQEQERVHIFYPRHLNIEMKPLEIKLNATNILQFWEFLGDEKRKQAATRKLVDPITDDTGRINEDKVETRSLLNEMAAHFSSLIKLENYLFQTDIKYKGDRRQKLKDLHYYLITENIDTLSFYLEDLVRQLEQKNIYASFYWMVHQIVLENFYSKAHRWIYRKDIESEDWKKFKVGLSTRSKVIKERIDLLSKDLGLTEQQMKWCKEQIAMQYEY